MRRARDMLPLVMALLTTGLERSFQLAESMEARGYGNVRPLPRARDALYKVLTLLGLAGVLGSAFAATYLAHWAGWAGVAISALLLVGVFWAQGRRVTRSRYHHARWTWRDDAAIAASAVALGAWIAIRATDGAALRYYPYTALLPPFRPWLGTVSLLLMVPTVVQAHD
jgi:energy-coupling factor transporter transmembrane protein EcfT